MVLEIDGSGLSPNVAHPEEAYPERGKGRDNADAADGMGGPAA